MKFADSEHEKRYLELVAICQFEPCEKDFAAAVFLLSAPLLSGKETAKYARPGEIRFSELLKKIILWSSSKKALAMLAAAMYNPYWKVDVNDVFWNLDAGNVELALEALRIRWG